MMRLVLAAIIAISDERYVERPGPGQAPTAFRIWAAGRNDSDSGPSFFTRESAEAILKEQAARGRVYSSDFDHLSVLTDRPATAGRASGWHDLEVRKDEQGEPELWAVNIRWTADAKAGLEADPPLWRFFSPAYRQDEEGIVRSYVNFALCINPQTHDLPALAAHINREERPMAMTYKEARALMARLKAEDISDEERAGHMAKLAEYFANEEGPGNEEKPPPEDKPKPKGEEPPAGPSIKAVPGSVDGEGSQEKETATKDDKATETEEQRAVMKLAATVQDQQKQLDGYEKEKLLVAAPHVAPSVAEWLKTQPLATVRSYLQVAPTKTGARPSTPTKGEDDGRPAGLQGDDLRKLNESMGIGGGDEPQFVRNEMGELLVRNVGPRKAAQLAKKHGSDIVFRSTMKGA